MKKLISLLSLCFCFSFIHAQERSSFMPHQGEVISVFSFGENSASQNAQNLQNETNVFYTVAKDGFIIRWNPDGTGYHYQLTDRQIKSVAVNPVKPEIAIYETNESSVNTVSVWDLKTFTKKFTLKINETVLCLTYSKKGTYLIAGTATEYGTAFINPNNGSLIKPVSEKLLMTSYVETSSSEKSLMCYAMTGHITYVDLTKGKILKKIPFKTGFDKMILFNKNRYIGCVKDKKIFIADAMTGKVELEIPAKNPVLYTYNDELYYFDSVQFAKNHSLFKFDFSDGKVKNPVIAYNFNGRVDGTISSFMIKDDCVFIGSTKGEIYKSNLNTESEFFIINQITEKNIKRAVDVVFAKDDLYILTEDSIYKSDEQKENVIKIADNPGYTNIEKYIHPETGVKLVLWSKDKQCTVSELDVKSKSIKELFTSKGMIVSLKNCANTIIDVENSSVVNRYNLMSAKYEELYYGSGIQDAVMTGEEDLYIAKSRSAPGDSPLIYVNTRTHETVQLKIDADLIYSLACDELADEKDSKYIYAIAVFENDSKAPTKILKYDTNSKNTVAIQSFATPDYSGDLYACAGFVFNKLCSSLVSYVTVQSKKVTTYKRSYSLAKKITAGKDNAVFLNYDGSLSWIDAKIPDIVADWYITKDERVLEY